MIKYRVVARCGGQERANLAIGDRRIPQRGDEYVFFSELGPVTVADTSFGQGESVVYVDVEPEVFAILTEENGWSVVALA